MKPTQSQDISFCFHIWRSLLRINQLNLVYLVYRYTHIYNLSQIVHSNIFQENLHSPKTNSLHNVNIYFINFQKSYSIFIITLCVHYSFAKNTERVLYSNNVNILIRNFHFHCVSLFDLFRICFFFLNACPYIY